MDDMLLALMLKKASLIIGVIGFLVGLDLLLGGKILNALKKTLDKSIDIDKFIIKTTSNIKKRLDSPAIDIDQAIASTNVRIILGVLCVTLSVLIVLLSRI